MRGPIIRTPRWWWTEISSPPANPATCRPSAAPSSPPWAADFPTLPAGWRPVWPSHGLSWDRPWGSLPGRPPEAAPPPPPLAQPLGLLGNCLQPNFGGQVPRPSFCHSPCSKTDRLIFFGRLTNFAENGPLPRPSLICLYLTPEGILCYLLLMLIREVRQTP